jgi:hypothetical protein
MAFSFWLLTFFQRERAAEKAGFVHDSASSTEILDDLRDCG